MRRRGGRAGWVFSFCTQGWCLLQFFGVLWVWNQPRALESPILVPEHTCTGSTLLESPIPVPEHTCTGTHTALGQSSSSSALALRHSWLATLSAKLVAHTFLLLQCCKHSLFGFSSCSVVFFLQKHRLHAHGGDDCWQLRSRSWGCWNVDIQLMGLNSAQVFSLFCETWWINSEFPVIWVNRDVDSQMF